MSDDGKLTIRALSSGRLDDLRRRIPNPVVALGSSRLFYTLVHGDSFELHFEGCVSITRGFYTTSIVAAHSAEQARQRAREQVLRRWQRDGYLARAGVPTLEIARLQAIPGRWRLRSGGGYTFYGAVEDRGRAEALS